MTATNWQAKARCASKTRAGHDPDAYREGHTPEETDVPSNIDRYNQFRRACWTHCYVRETCLAAAQLEEKNQPANNRYGIRGGLTPVQRVEAQRRANAQPE